MENLLLLDVPILKHIRGMTKNKKSIFIGVGGGGGGGGWEARSCSWGV